jgi:apolipoprotein N-acyltransferase
MQAPHPRPRRLAVLATLASALLYGLAFPPARLRPLAWVALVPLLVALRRVPTRTALGLAWLWTLAATCMVADWLPVSIADYYQQPLLIGFAFFLGVPTFMAVPYYVAFAASYRALAGCPSVVRPLAVAAAWVAAELGRATLLTGNPWALFGYSQIDAIPLIQIADVAGVYGITFVLVSVNAALAELFLAATDTPARPRAAAGALVTAALVLAAVLGYGMLRLRSLALVPPVRPVQVALVQGNLDLGSQWREEFYGENLDAYLRLTAEAIREHAPAVVFWPENAMTFFLEQEPGYRKAIERVLDGRAQLVAGGPRTDPERRYYNSIFLLSSSGRIVARYDKQRLVPFAEYFPFARLDLMRRRFARVRGFTPGGPPALLPTVAGPAGIMICNEAMFPEIAAARVRAGAAYLVDPANDSWFRARFSAQQFDIVRLRAVEVRRYLVRASTSGPSAIVDPAGRIVFTTAVSTQAVAGGEIRAGTVTTLYCRVGDLFAWLCVAGTVIGWVAGTRWWAAR